MAVNRKQRVEVADCADKAWCGQVRQFRGKGPRQPYLDPAALRFDPLLLRSPNTYYAK